MHSFSLLLIALAPLGALSQRISTDATCGGTKGYTCLGSAFGSCCSRYGWCGTTKNYCGVGCNPKFGTCTWSSTSSRTSSAARSSSTPSAATQLMSTNARCGPLFGGRTCLGSGFGDCCSQYSYCGSTSAYCAAKTCQKGYGKCNTVSSTARSYTQASTRSSTTVRGSSSSLVIPPAASSSSSSSSIVSSSSVAILVLSPPSSVLSSSSLAASSLSSSAAAGNAAAVPPSSTLASSTTQAASSSNIQVGPSSSAPVSSSSSSSPSASPLSSDLQATPSSSTAISSSSVQAVSSTSQIVSSLPLSFTLQPVSSSSIAAADAVASPSSSSSTTSQTSSSSADIASSSSVQAVSPSSLAISTPSAAASPSSIDFPSASQPTSTPASEPASLTSVDLTEGPSTTATAPQFTPSDASDFLAAYTFEDSALPTPTEMGTPPDTSGVTLTPPKLVKKCIIDPTKPDATFTLLEPKDRIPIIKQTTDNNLLGPIQAPAGEPDLDNIDEVKFTSYSFVAGSNGLFDIITSTNPRQYIARLSDGSVGLAEQSAGADSLQKATTIFEVTCEGRITVRIGSQHYNWVLDGDKLVMAAAEGTPETMYTVPDVAVPKRRRRNIWQQGAAPRCDLNPQPLEARVFPGARQTHPDQCGANGLNVLDPQFASCCSQLSVDYDDCGRSFEDANTRFYTCMRATGCAPYRITSTWRIMYPLYVGCMQSARYYYSLATGYAGQVAFYQANSERCKCYCGSPTPDACTVNNSLQCLDVFSADLTNCGACGRKCPDTARCVSGTCKCPVDQCGDRCVTLASHPQNCGQCGRVSLSGYCVNGQPWYPPACSRTEGFTNGGFANDLTDWSSPATTAARFTVIADSGAQDADKKSGLFTLAGTLASTRLATQIRLCPNTAYALKFQIRRPAGSGVCTYRVSVANEVKGSGPLLAPAQGGVAWQWITATVGPYAGARTGVEFRVPDLYATFYLDVICTGTQPNYILVDQFSVVPGSAAALSSLSSSVARSSTSSTASATSTVPTAVRSPACVSINAFSNGNFSGGAGEWATAGTPNTPVFDAVTDNLVQDADKQAGHWKLQGTTVNADLTTTVKACPGITYNLEFQLRRPIGNNDCTYSVFLNNARAATGTIKVDNVTLLTDWRSISGTAGPFGVEGSSPDVPIDFRLNMVCSGFQAVNTFWVDQFSMFPTGASAASQSSLASVASSTSSATPSSTSVSSSRSMSSSTSTASPTPNAPACSIGEGFTGGHFDAGLSAWTATPSGSRWMATMDFTAEDADRIVAVLGVPGTKVTTRISSLVLACANSPATWKFQLRRPAGDGNCSYSVLLGRVVKVNDGLPNIAQGENAFKWYTGVAGPFVPGTAGVTDKGAGILAVEFALEITCDGASGSSDGLNYISLDQFSMLPS